MVVICGVACVGVCRGWVYAVCKKHIQLLCTGSMLVCKMQFCESYKTSPSLTFTVHAETGEVLPYHSVGRTWRDGSFKTDIPWKALHQVRFCVRVIWIFIRFYVVNLVGFHSHFTFADVVRLTHIYIYISIHITYLMLTSLSSRASCQLFHSNAPFSSCST